MIYLLDTNIVSALYNPEHPLYIAHYKRLKQLRNANVKISLLTIF